MKLFEQKHRKVTKMEINNFDKLRTLCLQNMITQKEISVKIRDSSNEYNPMTFPGVTETDVNTSCP